MPNFIVPVVGNPNGGFQNGDQVTAENLNAHVQEAIPTGDFILGRQTSSVVEPSDWFLKVGSDGNIYKVNGSTVSPLTIKANEINSPTGDGSTSPYGNLYIRKYGDINIFAGAAGPFNANTTGQVDIRADGIYFNFNREYSGEILNQFAVGWPARSEVSFHAQTFEVDSANPAEFNGTHALKIPAGTTAQRPNPSAVGQVRYNTDLQDLEYNGSAGWGSVKNSGTVVYAKQLPALTFAAGVTLWETPNAIVVPEGEVWIYELNYQFNSANWGGNTRPEWIFQTELSLGTVPKVTMNCYTGAYGGPLSSATAAVTVTRADTHVNGTDFPKKLIWKCISVGRFGSWTDGVNAYGYVKLTRVKTAAQGTTQYL